MEITKLPVDLSNRILEQQIELDTSSSLSASLISSTLQLYAEAISFYSSIINEQQHIQGFNAVPYAKRSKYYQEKMKKLMVRPDIQHCLSGKQGRSVGVTLQKDLEMVNKHASQQARALANYYNTHISNQQRMIEKTLVQQKTNLDDRILRRSRSKHKKTPSFGQIDMPHLVPSPLPIKKSLIYVNY